MARTNKIHDKLCPKGWAWLVYDCDFGQNCSICDIDEAPINNSDEIIRTCDFCHTPSDLLEEVLDDKGELYGCLCPECYQMIVNSSEDDEV